MKADRRQVLARVVIDYTDPFMDQSLEIEANEQANISYPQQTADSVDQTTRKYACLDGTWDLTTGEYYLAPSADQLTQQQFGWWGAQFCDQDGYFASPYPTLTVTHLPRPIWQLKVVGDAAREEWPVDFQIKLYGPDDTLLKTETITDNDQISWSKTLDPEVLDVAKQELIITRWSLPGTCAKIIEFFTSIREVYETGDLVNLRLLEEREASQGSLPVGNISSNEITLALNNESKKFDIDNDNSPLKNLLKPNRRIQAWLGAEAENAATENPPTFTRNSVAYLSDGTQVAANVPRFEQGKFGKAVLVEEGTENLFDNPGWLSGDLTGWNLYSSGGGNGLRQVIDDDRFGKALRINKTDGGTGRYGVNQDKTWDPSGVGIRVTTTIYVKILSTQLGGRFCCFTDYRNDGLGEIYYGGGFRFYLSSREVEARSGGTTTIEDVGDGWYKIVHINAETTIASGPIYFWIDNADADVLVAWAQNEPKSYSTSFTDGTRAAETLTVSPASKVISDSGPWTIECWAKSNVDSSNWRMVFDAWSVFYIGISPAYNTLNLSYTDGSQVSVAGGTVQNINDWHYYVLTFDGTTCKVYLDGEKRIDTDVNFTKSLNNYALKIASWHAYPWNGLVDCFRISSRARTDEEILAAYQSNKPLQRDKDTTYLLSFNGSIYPVEMCWVPLGTFWSLDWDSPDDTLEATVTARDRMELLRKGTYQTSQVQQNKSLYELAEAVLQDAGLASDEYIIDTALQNIIVPYAWFNPMSHREALRQIAEAGLAAAFANREGKIQIESFLITSDEPVLEITEDDYFPPLRAPSRQDQVANEIIVDTQPLRPAAATEEVYRSNEPITIPASSTKAITAFYNQPPVIEAVASLDNPPAGVSITDATYYGWGASVKIQNTNTTDKQVIFVIQGRPLTVQNKERAIARDEASILENGILRYEFPENPLVQTLAQAQAIADALLASVKEPRRDIEVDWRGNPALLLGDRVTVKGKDYHVIRQEIDWAGALSARLIGRKSE
jgi:hypothetical protein